jgi:serine/threonine protein kinase
MIDTVGGSANCLAPGIHIGEYRLLDVIGEGGFGIVYRARDVSLDRIVAIKEYMPATLAGRKSSNEIHVRSQHRGAFDAGLRSFINEARLLAKFSHPALVHVYRFFEFNGTAYMVMRHYEGQTFRTFLSAQHDRMNQRMLSAILSPILDVVEMLHAADCYHRDIAPDNVFLQHSGMPVLLDFGAARRIIGDMTQALTMVLKPGFAPIEQYVDDGAMPQGAWTDIYQIGAMLYLAITGKPPATSVARMINDPVAELTSVNYAGYSPRFLHGVHRALSVKPQDRPQSIGELKELLDISTFTSPIFNPWTLTTAPGLGRLVPDPSERSTPTNTAPAPRHPAPASPDIEASSADESHVSGSLYGLTANSKIAQAAAAAPNHRAGEPEALIPGAPLGLQVMAITGSDKTLGNKSAAFPAAEQSSVPLSDAVAISATHSEVVFPTEPPAANPAPSPTGSAPLANNSSAARWVAAAIVLVVATTMLSWWGSRDISVAEQISAPPPTSDEQHWQGAKNLGTVAALDAYLEAEPEGRYRSEAFALINRLESAESVLSTTTSATPPPAETASAPVPPSPERVPLPDSTAKPETVTTASTITDPDTTAKAAPKPAGDLGRVVLRISPWGRVSVNGSAQGTTPPLTQLELPEGAYRIEVSNPAAASVVRTVQIKKGEPVVVSHQFE